MDGAVKDLNQNAGHLDTTKEDHRTDKGAFSTSSISWFSIGGRLFYLGICRVNIDNITFNCNHNV